MALKQLTTDVVDSTTVRIYGHSFTTGFGLGDASLRMGALIAEALGANREINYGINGAVLANPDTSTAGGISMIAQKEKRYRRKAPWSPALDVGVLVYGINDMVLLGQTGYNALAPLPEGLAIFKNAYRTALCILRSSARFYAGNKTGGLDANIALNTAANWTNFVHPVNPTPPPNSTRRGTNSVSGSLGYITTTTNGATGAVTLTIPGGYLGSAVTPLYIMMVADPALTAGTLTATGAASGTFDLIQTTNGKPGTCDVQNVQKNLIVWRFTGNAIPASSTIQTITITPSALAGGTWGFAEFGIESEAPPILRAMLINYGNPGTPLGTLLSNSSIDTWNAGIQAIVNEFDTTVQTVDINAAMGGIGNLNVSSTKTNGAITATSPANTEALTVLDTTNFAATGVIQVSNAFGPGEYMAYTGKTPTTFTGLTRASYGSAAAIAGDVSYVTQVNPAAIPNFADGLHPSEKGHSIFARAVVQSVSSALTSATQTFRSAGSKADVRLELLATREQLVWASPTFGCSLVWDTSLVDTIQMHDPATLANLGVITIPVDGLYLVQASMLWGIGKRVSAGPVALGGYRTLNIGKNFLGFEAGSGGNPANTYGQTTSYPTVADQTTSWPCCLTSHSMFECRAGDTLMAYASQNSTQATTTSTVAVNASATAITVTSGTGIANNDYLRVESEIVLVTAGGGTTSLTITRGQLGSSAVSHATGVGCGVGIACTIGTFNLHRLSSI